MIHAYTVDRLKARASRMFGVDEEKLGVVSRCNTRDADECRDHRVLWALIAATRELGATRKALAHLFGASESTVARAIREANRRDVRRLLCSL